jgi:hypothetical protein
VFKDITRESAMKNEYAESSYTSADVIAKLLEAIESIRYGSVEIIIHDRRIVQIERKEKVRFDTTLTHRY